MKRFIAFLAFFNVAVASIYHFQLFDFSNDLGNVDTALSAPALETSIMLVSEHFMQPTAATSALPKLKEEPIEEKVCYLIDPVEEAVVVSLSTELASANLVFSDVLYQSNEVTSHWVHIPALESLAEAHALHAEILALGVEDIYVIEAGKNKNSISLGIYRDHAAAVSHAEWFAKKNIDVEIAPRYKSHTVYRVDVGPLFAQQGEILLSILEGKFSELKYQKKSCK